MIFFNVTNIFDVDENIEGIYLIRSNWNDWFKYRTVHRAYLVREGTMVALGSLRIASKDMKDDSIPNLQKSFKTLSDNFFSLGTNHDFYMNLNTYCNSSQRREILKSLNDMAYNLDIFEENKDLEVVRISLLRDKNEDLVLKSYHSLAIGNSVLEDYSLEYIANSDETLVFEVSHDQLPPSNIHAIIGRNGVGKSHLLKNMAYSYMKGQKEAMGFSEKTTISNLIYVNFSTFESYHHELIEENKHAKNKISYLCPESKAEDFDTNEYLKKNGQAPMCDDLTNVFIDSLLKCIHYSPERWKSCVEILNSDPILAEKNIQNLVPKYEEKGLSLGYIETVVNLFKLLSSGHKIVLLTLTKLVSCATDKTLILMDEPELHLHPPLLGSFVRSISNLLKSVNGIAIMATHSPVILQETNRQCIYKLEKYISSNHLSFTRPEMETFAESIGILTSDVFGLEVMKSGFYQVLDHVASISKNFEEALNHFNGHVGKEGRSILLSKTHKFKGGED